MHFFNRKNKVTYPFYQLIHTFAKLLFPLNTEVCHLPECKRSFCCLGHGALYVGAHCHERRSCPGSPPLYKTQTEGQQSLKICPLISGCLDQRHEIFSLMLRQLCQAGGDMEIASNGVSQCGARLGTVWSAPSEMHTWVWLWHFVLCLQSPSFLPLPQCFAAATE